VEPAEQLQRRAEVDVLSEDRREARIGRKLAAE
jgi:hypothetical protein